MNPFWKRRLIGSISFVCDMQNLRMLSTGAGARDEVMVQICVIICPIKGG
jgi:hypothetical protein